MDDLISRQAAIDAAKDWYDGLICGSFKGLKKRLEALPSVQPDEEKISDALYRIYRNTSPHTSAEGVAAVKYYIREIYREIYGEEGPTWLKK